MAKKNDRDRLIRTFQARTVPPPAAHTKRQMGFVKRGAKRTGATFTRSSATPPGGYYREDDPRWVSPRVIPGYGQVRNKQRPQRRGRRTVGNPEGVPPRTRWTYPKGRTRPTPGSANRRRPRTYN